MSGIWPLFVIVTVPGYDEYGGLGCAAHHTCRVISESACEPDLVKSIHGAADPEGP